MWLLKKFKYVYKIFLPIHYYVGTILIIANNSEVIIN